MFLPTNHFGDPKTLLGVQSECHLHHNNRDSSSYTLSRALCRGLRHNSAGILLPDPSNDYDVYFQFIGNFTFPNDIKEIAEGCIDALLNPGFPERKFCQ